MTAPTVVRVWTMRLDGVGERHAAPWLRILDDAERARAARFVFPKHRVQFIAAHALARAALSSVANTPVDAWSFVDGEHGKPAARLGVTTGPVFTDPVSFNISHTEGMVGIAAMAHPNRDVGFDIERIGRTVTLSIADRYFRPEEVGWLRSMPQSVQPAAFLQLWTLKEAFIKATGKGLSQDLAAFWFETSPPRIHFTPMLPGRSAEWLFEQRVIDGTFIAAAGVRKLAEEALEIRWTAIDPLTFDPSAKPVAAASQEPTHDMPDPGRGR